MKKKQWIVLAVGFACYIATLQFFRFKFGLFPISIAFAVVGIPLMLLIGRPTKPNSN